MKQRPNMKSYEKEYRDFSLSLPQYFSFPLDVFDRWGKRTALFWTDGAIDRKFTFDELKTLSSKSAGAFRKIDMKKGDKVLVMLPNIPEWWEVMLGLMRLHAVPIPATTLLTEKDIQYRLSATDIKAIITTEEDAPKVEAAVNHASVSLCFSLREKERDGLIIKNCVMQQTPLR